MKFSLFLGCTVALLSIANTAVAKVSSNTTPIAQTQIAANPQTVQEYLERGVAREEKKDFQGALADYNQAIAMDPTSIEAYLVRGALKGFTLSDYKGGEADFSKIIELDPQIDIAYFSRGILRAYNLNNREDGIEDLRTTVKLLRARNEPAYLQSVLDVLQELGATE
jgi:tetratricopeptide (TPR) repeat protein